MSSSQLQCERLRAEATAFLEAIERLNVVRNPDSPWKAGLTAAWHDISGLVYKKIDQSLESQAYSIMQELTSAGYDIKM